MPLYHKTLTVSKNTPEANPVKLEILIQQRIIVKVDVKFPRGCHDMVHITGFYGIKQLFPYEKEDSITGNAESVSTLEWLEAPEVPFKITIKGWSPGTAYSHSPIIRVVTLPDALDAPARLLTRVLKKLDVWLWRIFRV